DLGDTGRPPLELPGPDPRRRSRLPAPPAPSGDVSLWGLLRSSVGKDLSRVALPVQLNEPLNTLQRLCEELEYSELLDRASRARDPRQRLVYVAAFAVSAYASTYYRAGSKPFNPVLGETYECVRPDRGFRFISEQVGTGRGPGGLPELGRWALGGWKNKFWGKSLEIVPMGTVNVQLTGDHYEWNKVTTCIHNVLSGPRWIEHYGEVLIRNTRDASYHCKLTFCKVCPAPSCPGPLCVHQILVLLRPFLGLSVAAEGCEGEEGAAAGPSPGRGARDPLSHPPVPLTWPPEMSGAEGMRCRASRCCSMPVSSCSLAWHSDSSARGTGVRGGHGHPARPRSPLGPRSPAEQRSSPSLSFSQAFTLSRELASADRAGALPEGSIRVHWPCTGHRGHRSCQEPPAQALPGAATLSCHPPACWSPWSPPGDTAPAVRRGGGSTGCSPSWRTPPGT
uniref:Uncharacterized protein n=1 Tax=Junco hyemalis TaxID=40217 RepID=A0A8C5IXQ0_JUNHY